MIRAINLYKHYMVRIQKLILFYAEAIDHIARVHWHNS